jgi:hypothetical protein
MQGEEPVTPVRPDRNRASPARSSLGMAGGAEISAPAGRWETVAALSYFASGSGRS